MTSEIGIQTRPQNKIQLLQGSFKFTPKLADRDLARFTLGLGQTIWKFSNNEATLQKLYETYLNTRIAFSELLEFANRVKREKPKAKFRGCIFAIKLNEDDKDEKGHYIKVLKPYQYTLKESENGYTNEFTLHFDIINIKITRTKTEEEKEAAKELRKQMKERTLKSDKKKEYKTAGVQTESIPELAPLTRPLRRLNTWHTWRNRKKTTKDDSSDLSDDETPPPPSPSSPPPPPPPSPPKSRHTSTHTSRGTSPPPPQRPPIEKQPQKEGEFTIDRNNKSHDWSSLVNDDDIESDVIDDYLKLLHDKGIRLNKQPGQKEAEFNKNNILVLPTSFYYYLKQAIDVGGDEHLKEFVKLKTLVGKRKFETYEKVFIPIWLDENHWVMCGILPKLKRIECFDSQTKTMANEVRNLNKFLEAQGTDKYRAYYRQVPQQTSQKDCGVFVMEFVRTCLHEGNGEFHQKDVPDIRKRILQELRSNTLETGVAYK